MLNQLKDFLATIRDHEQRLRSLESFNQVKKFVIGGNTIFDENGLVSSTNFANSNTTHGSPQTFTTNGWVDLADSQFPTITVSRDTLILFILKVEANLTESVGNTGNAVIMMNIDGVRDNAGAIFLYSGNDYNRTYEVIYPKILGEGTHTVKAQARFETINTGSPTLNIAGFFFYYIQMGS
ncbi:MAG TPA: hypothetical protein VH186_06210 [Chloroflexia bacterium]|nr:hypothetical protein [Chloroflexia bacterium]